MRYLIAGTVLLGIVVVLRSLPKAEDYEGEGWEPCECVRRRDVA